MRGASLSLGVLANHDQETRVGLRTRRGLKGAVERNRLKRQLRTLLFTSRVVLRRGVDVVVVIHPSTLPAGTPRLATELETLCKRAGILSLRT